jgi:hypothetical protein
MPNSHEYYCESIGCIQKVMNSVAESTMRAVTSADAARRSANVAGEAVANARAITQRFCNDCYRRQTSTQTPSVSVHRIRPVPVVNPNDLIEILLDVIEKLETRVSALENKSS